MQDARLRRHSLPYVAPLEPHTGLKASLQKRGQSVPDQMKNVLKMVFDEKIVNSAACIEQTYCNSHRLLESLLGQHKNDSNNRIKTVTGGFCVLFIYNWIDSVWLKEVNSIIILLSVIQLSVFPFSLFYLNGLVTTNS